MGVCALTGKSGTFVRSLLYPQAFYDPPENGAPFKAIGGNKGSRPKTLWTGLYDENLVISDGEKLLADLDNYAATALRPSATPEEFFGSADEIQMSGRGDKIAVGLFKNLDVEKLLLFFASILWRFGASTREEASRIDLGPYLEIFRKAIIEREAPDNRSFGVSLLRIVDAEGSFAFTPARYSASGVNMWQLVFGNFQINIRCDKRRPPFPYREMEMNSEKPVAIMAYDFTRSRSYENVARMVRTSSQAHGWPWGNKWPRDAAAK